MNKLSLYLSAVLLVGFAPVRADEMTSEKGRSIFFAHQDSILSFSSLISVSASAGGRSGGTREQTVLGVGTVITDDGLMVTALSAINPTAMLSGQKMNTPQGKVEVNYSVQYKELKIIMPDGLEIPADLVMKDMDLDLAFLRPKAGNEDAKDVKFHPIDLAESATGEILDEVLIVGRLGKTFSYQPSGWGSEITAKIEKPRLCYRVAGVSAGTPVYTVGGKLLGLGASRKPNTDDGDVRAALGDTLVVLPAAEIVKIADQAKKAKPAPEDAADKQAENPPKKEEKPASKDDAK
jgi:hypothetical protein